MTYTRIERPHPSLLIILFLLISSDWFSGNPVLNAFLWLFLVCLVMALGINYQLEVEDHQMCYRLSFLSFRLYKKTMTPDSINSIIFKRADWTKKKAVIKVKKGMNIRVMDYEPTQVFIALHKFTADHGIATKKTRDYKLLEKYY
jgi:hypothetical protein